MRCDVLMRTRMPCVNGRVRVLVRTMHSGMRARMSAMRGVRGVRVHACVHVCDAMRLRMRLRCLRPCCGIQRTLGQRLHTDGALCDLLAVAHAAIHHHSRPTILLREHPYSAVRHRRVESLAESGPQAESGQQTGMVAEGLHRPKCGCMLGLDDTPQDFLPKAPHACCHRHRPRGHRHRQASQASFEPVTDREFLGGEFPAYTTTVCSWRIRGSMYVPMGCSRSI